MRHHLLVETVRDVREAGPPVRTRQVVQRAVVDQGVVLVEAGDGQRRAAADVVPGKAALRGQRVSQAPLVFEELEGAEVEAFALQHIGGVRAQDEELLLVPARQRDDLVGAEVDQQCCTEKDDQQRDEPDACLPPHPEPPAVVEVLPVQVRRLARLLGVDLGFVEVQVLGLPLPREPVPVRPIRVEDDVLQLLVLEHHDSAANLSLLVNRVTLRAHLVVEILDLLCRLCRLLPVVLSLLWFLVILGNPLLGLQVRLHVAEVRDLNEAFNVPVILALQSDLVYRIVGARSIGLLPVLVDHVLEVLRQLLLIPLVHV
mmetsp:Transcript_86453/g.186937  ORF Transcript_86453/g.186937 Transcript_86453/m.186937 type:complete len:315 (-) Transcript_86453:980-1924(-)